MTNNLPPPQRPFLAPVVASRVRSSIPAMSEHITAQIQEAVEAYSGHPDGRRRELIETAVRVAITYFVEVASGRGPNRAVVDEHFRQLGRGEAIEGNDLQAMNTAYDVAARDAWKAIRQFANVFGMSTESLGELGDGLFSYMEHLTTQVSIGYDAGLSALNQDVLLNRAKLARALLDGADSEELDRASGAAHWPLPDEFVIFAAQTPDGFEPPHAALFDDILLARVDGSVSTLICDAALMSTNVGSLQTLFGSGRLAASWPVPGDQVRDAHRWTRRALDLAARGVIVVQPEEPIWCEDHVTLLWLHSEEHLRTRLASDVLRPLESLSDYARAGLAATLLAWLETSGSAPRIARMIDVHPQTVRFRIRKLREIFGAQLDDPDARLALHLSLRTDRSLWKPEQAVRSRRSKAQRSRTRPSRSAEERRDDLV